MSSVPAPGSSPAPDLDDFDFARLREIKRLHRRESWSGRVAFLAAVSSPVFMLLGIAIFSGLGRLPTPTRECVGACLGLLSALGMCLGPYMFMRYQRVVSKRVAGLYEEHDKLIHGKRKPKPRPARKRRQ